MEFFLYYVGITFKGSSLLLYFFILVRSGGLSRLALYLAFNLSFFLSFFLSLSFFISSLSHFIGQSRRVGIRKHILKVAFLLLYLITCCCN